MGRTQELKTVATDARGQPSRKYESLELTPGVGPIAAATTKLVLTMALIKNLFWGSSEAPANSAQNAEDERLPTRPEPETSVEAGDEPKESDNTKAAESGNLVPGETGLFKARAMSTVLDTDAAEDQSAARQSPFGRMQPIPGNDNHAPHAIAPFDVGQSIRGQSETPHGGGGSGSGVQPAERKNDKSDETPSQRSNRAPVVAGAVVFPGLQMNHTVLIGLSDLLQNVSDPDGDTLTVVDLKASSGTLVAHDNGTWFFTPEAEDSSQVTFSYRVTDGIASVSQSASMDLLPQPVESNLHVGTEGPDVLYATAGNDVIEGLSGDDVIFAGDGDDLVSGGDGADVIYGGGGNDLINGGNGNDIVFAGAGNDRVFAGAGDDLVFGGGGDDLIHGEDGIDVLFGEDGDDVLHGGAGGDALIGGAGSDVAQGDGGNDTFVATTHDGNDIYDGGSGVDTLDLSATAAPATINLAIGSASSADIANDVLTSIENVIGSGAGDTIIGSDIDNVLTGGAGEDVAHGGSASDTFVATAHDDNDIYDGGSGVDTLDLSATAAPATINLAIGSASSADIANDVLTSIENVIGSSGDDVIVANGDRNILTGGNGNDTFVFSDLASSPGTNDLWDLIKDFAHGDKLDVSFIDANRDEDGQQQFLLRLEPSNSDEGSNRGSIRFRYEQADDGEHTIVRGYVDEDEIADLLIDLLGRHTLSEGDFVLEWHQ